MRGMDFAYWQWALFALAALIIGMSKGGVPGLGILNVAIFQLVLLGKGATGFSLLLLVTGDFCSMLLYRRHAAWRQVLRLIPWAAVGVVLGYFALDAMSDGVAKRIISVTLLCMLVLGAFRNKWPDSVGEALGKRTIWAAAIGILAAFVSTLANAAGPVMILYLLSMRLPKLAFMGTSVYFFTFLNLFKIPFIGGVGLITSETLVANAKLAPFVVAGSLLGYATAKKISQVWFERVAFWLTAAAVTYMLWNSFLAS